MAQTLIRPQNHLFFHGRYFHLGSLDGASREPNAPAWCSPESASSWMPITLRKSKRMVKTDVSGRKVGLTMAMRERMSGDDWDVCHARAI